MALNKLSDLNNHLFAQLERLSDEDLKGEALAEEIHRSWAVTRVAEQIIRNASLVLQANIAVERDMLGNAKLPRMLEGE
ncbi:hypothetical protein [Pseudodesulfovibrio indicus]|uniref:Phage protein n=1 Tax=Pseudodesulfovibrio indicus TaxID=1716143 RepID=A0A126QRS0_9BACT|nr:hypothetical protein [Pseudodesulfovibrio indicus]AMK12468.1 hypothetical protein AWY79_15850 [Pseudodesulfovibrio indicus]TDT90772.1 hypothetical protein EDC59_102202 [Pseudodesulfovibrio indicus]